LHPRRLRRRQREWLLLATMLLAVVAMLGSYNALERPNLVIADQLMRLVDRPVSDEIVLIAIDDKSLAAIGRWPWRRGFHAALLDQLTPARPKAVGMDLILTEQDPVYAADDAVLADAMRRNGKVVLPLALQDNYGAGKYTPLLPVPVLAASAAAIGHIQLQLDADGIVRTAYLREGDGAHWWSHLGVATLEAGGFTAGNRDTPSVQTTNSTPHPWVRDHLMQIPFVGAPAHFQQVSYVDVLKGQVPPSTFTGKYVLVGATSAGMGDAYATPRSGNAELTAGVEISANVMNALLMQQRVQRATGWRNAAFCVVPVALGLLAILWLSPTASLLASATLILLTLGASWLAMRYAGISYAPTAALIGLLAAYPLWMWRRLSAATGYLLQEFRRMETRHEFPPMQPAKSLGDPLERHIHALQNASAQLRNLHRFVSDVLSHLPDATIISDSAGQVLMANQAAEQYFQHLGIQQVAKQALADLLRDVHLQVPGIPALQDNSLAKTTDIWTIESKDIAGNAVLVRCVPCFDTGGIATGWITSLVDISAIRAAEQQRDEALRFISHDMRSPQSSILALLELQRMQPATSIGPDTLQRIERYAQRTLHLAEEFVQLAHAKSNAYRMQTVDLSELLNEAVDEVWPQAQARGIRFKLHLADQPAWCEADRGLLTRAIGNLLSNAVKYGPAHSEVHCSVQELPGRWQLAIADVGPGLSTAQQELLFQHFVRLQPDRKSAPKGVGLGLVFVRTVVERLGGRIQLSSAPGHGTVLQFSLAKSTE